jgi:hypothetical protein
MYFTRLYCVDERIICKGICTSTLCAHCKQDVEHVEQVVFRELPGKQKVDVELLDELEFGGDAPVHRIEEDGWQASH